MTDLELYRRLLDLLHESGLSKQEKLDILERASKVVKEEAETSEPKPSKDKRAKSR